MTYVWLGFIGLILVLIGGAFLYGRRSGKDAVARDVAEDAAEISQKQAEAQANAPRSKDAIIDRLRNGGGL